MLARNLDEVKAWLAPQLASGALEVSVLGDIDVDAVIASPPGRSERFQCGTQGPGSTS